jgi:AraC-like DNA-binding protein
MSSPELITASEQLSRIPGLHSISVSEAEAAIGSRYRPHRLKMPEGEMALDFRHHAIACDGASFNLLRYGPDIEVEAGVFDTFYMLEFPLSGGVDIFYGKDRISSGVNRGLILSPGPFVRSNWRQDTTQIMLRLDRDLVERSYQKFTGDVARRTPVFKPEINLDTPAGRRLSRLLALTVSEQIECGDGTFISPLPLVKALLETLFANIPCTGMQSAALAACGPLPHYLHRFRALLDDPASLPLSVAALCQQLGVSQRTLTTAMRRFTGLSPHDYLSMRRMEHARSLLERSDLPVSVIGQRVGYAHAGRFAAAFRRHFGTNPSRFSEA